MIPSFIITFRETLEAALIVGIILSYLVKTEQTKYSNVVYGGIISGIFSSSVVAFLFNGMAGGFDGRAEEIFEGITTLFGAVLLTTMIFWMMKQKHIAKELETRVAQELNQARKFGLFLVVYIAILREGVETVIFLGASNLVTGNTNLMVALAGILAAVMLGYAIFVSSLKIDLKKFFNITNLILIFFAAGLLAYGVHEFQEAAIIPTAVEHLWDVNPPLNPDGSYPVLHEKGHVGSILKGLFGYNGNHSLIEVMSYFFYLSIVLVLWKRIERLHLTARI